jgi:hypothetical protein
MDSKERIKEKENLTSNRNRKGMSYSFKNKISLISLKKPRLSLTNIHKIKKDEFKQFLNNLYPIN